MNYKVFLFPTRYNVACRSGSICIVINRHPVSESRSSWLYISNKDQGYKTYTFTSPLSHFVLVLNDEVLLLIWLGVCFIHNRISVYCIALNRLLSRKYEYIFTINFHNLLGKNQITKGLMHNYLHKSIYLSMCL
jgi:hypothetical protein